MHTVAIYVGREDAITLYEAMALAREYGATENTYSIWRIYHDIIATDASSKS